MKSNTPKIIFVLFIFFFCASATPCQTPVPKDWQKINADGLFTFRLPPGFKKTDMAGVENYLGEYLKGGERFLFVHGDTGSNAYDVRHDPEMKDYREIETSIDGKRANIRTFYLVEDGKQIYTAELNVGDWAHANVELYMQMTGNSPAVFKTAKQIFYSIDFR